MENYEPEFIDIIYFVIAIAAFLAVIFLLDVVISGALSFFGRG